MFPVTGFVPMYDIVRQRTICPQYYIPTSRYKICLYKVHCRYKLHCHHKVQCRYKVQSQHKVRLQPLLVQIIKSSYLIIIL